MLEVLSGAEVVFNPFSESDQRLKGEMVLKNPTADRYAVFKIKSTDVNAFQADPSKGIISPRETVRINILTVRSVDAEYAKVLSQKNKFLIEYAMLSRKPESNSSAFEDLKGPIAQNIKIYINTSSVRGSHLSRANREPSVVASNRHSFHSMAQNGQNKKLASSPIIIEQPDDELDRLKYEIDTLEKQRARLSKDIDGKGKGAGKGGILKYLLVLAVGLIGGNLVGHYSGADKFIREKLDHTTVQAPPPIKKQQEGGFFSIFNFGGDEEQVVIKKAEPEKSWWNIL